MEDHQPSVVSNQYRLWSLDRWVCCCWVLGKQSTVLRFSLAVFRFCGVELWHGSVFEG